MSGSREQAIIAAYRRLPLLQDISDEDLTHRANGLLIGARLMAVNRLPRANNSQAERGAQKEIEKLAELCSGLGKHILSMHSDALRALENAACKPHPLLLVDTLKETIFAACDALDLGKFTAPKKGAPLKRYESSMTDHLLRDYGQLTGKRGSISARDGTAYGEFLDFLKDVMPVLGINKGFESQARVAIRKQEAQVKRGA